MDKDELVKHLGTIAGSGTREMAAKLKAAKNNGTYIGQFGIGFYSTFKAAHTVEVRSRKKGSKTENIWKSAAGTKFTVEEVTTPKLDFGTEITLHLRNSSEIYLKVDEIKSIISQHAGYIDYPIEVWETRTEEYEVEIVEEPKTEEEKADTEEKTEKTEEAKSDEEEIEEDTDNEEEKAEAKPKTKTETRTITEWVVINNQRPIWLADASTLSKENYTAFYQSLSKNDKEEPMAYVHFEITDPIEFKAILYIPAKANAEIMQQPKNQARNIRIHNKRVFVTDIMDEFIPQYLSFPIGVVDCAGDELHITASRNDFQKPEQKAELKKIGTKIVSKSLEMFKNLAKDDEAYMKFWKEFGMNLKLAIMEDKKNQKKIEKLLRFDTSKFNETKTSLDGYISRMKKDQKQIFYMTGDKVAAVNNSVLIQGPKARGYEVLLLGEPIDEYLMQHLGSAKYQGKKFKDVSTGDLEYGDETKESKAAVKAEKKKFEPLIEYIKDALSDSVSEVRLSQRVTKAPAVIVASEHGWSGNKQRVMEAQAVGNQQGFLQEFYAKQKKELELNAKHPLIKALLTKVEASDGEIDANTNLTLSVFWDSTLLQSGFQIRNVAKFSKRLDKILRQNLNVDENAEAEVVVKPAEERAEEEKTADEAAKEKSEAKLEAQVDGAEPEADEEDVDDMAGKFGADTDDDEATDEPDMPDMSELLKDLEKEGGDDKEETAEKEGESEEGQHDEL